MRATRLLVESAAIALGAARLSAEQIDLAVAANAALHHATGVDIAAVEARSFHDALLAGCPNSRMLALLDDTARSNTPSAAAHGANGALGALAAEIGRVVDEHAAILAMIAAGAPQRDVEHALRQHALTSTLCSIAG